MYTTRVEIAGSSRLATREGRSRHMTRSVKGRTVDPSTNRADSPLLSTYMMLMGPASPSGFDIGTVM